VVADSTTPEDYPPYPGTWQEFLTWFGDEMTALAYVEQLRRTTGFCCPICKGPRGLADGQWALVLFRMRARRPVQLHQSRDPMLPVTAKPHIARLTADPKPFTQSLHRLLIALKKQTQSASSPPSHCSLSSPSRRCKQTPMDLCSVRYVPGSICQPCPRSVPRGLPPCLPPNRVLLQAVKPILFREIGGFSIEVAALKSERRLND
jgi:hypothetical protein